MEKVLRIMHLVSNGLNDEKIMLEDRLENLMNSERPVGELKDEIIGVMKEIALIDSTGGVWEAYLTSINNSNPEKNN